MSILDSKFLEFLERKVTQHFYVICLLVGTILFNVIEQYTIKYLTCPTLTPHKRKSRIRPTKFMGIFYKKI